MAYFSLFAYIFKLPAGYNCGQRQAHFVVGQGRAQAAAMAAAKG
jgi:hypothetical protein